VAAIRQQMTEYRKRIFRHLISAVHNPLRLLVTLRVLYQIAFEVILNLFQDLAF
jgi:hypothetical protein